MERWILKLLLCCLVDARLGAVQALVLDWDVVSWTGTAIGVG